MKFGEQRRILRQPRVKPDVAAVTTPAQVAEARAAVEAVHVAPSIDEYVLDLADDTRRASALARGVSPRASQALHRAARALAVRLCTQVALDRRGVLRRGEGVLTRVFDLPVAVGLERAARRSASDRFESATLAFFERVRDAYLERAARFPERFVLIDATQDEEAVWSQVEQALESRMAA